MIIMTYYQCAVHVEYAKHRMQPKAAGYVNVLSLNGVEQLGVQQTIVQQQNY